MAAATFPHFPDQAAYVLPQLSVISKPPGTRDNLDFSNRGDNFLAEVVTLSQTLHAAGVSVQNKGLEARAAVADLRTASAQSSFPLQRQYLGAFSADPVGADASGLSVGDVYFNTSDNELRVYRPNPSAAAWVRLSSTRIATTPLVLSNQASFGYRARRVITAPANQASFSLDLNNASHFIVDTNRSTSLSFSYTADDVATASPFALSFTVELIIRAGGSVSFPADVAWNGGSAPVLQAEARHVVRIRTSRNAAGPVGAVLVQNTMI